MLKLTLPEAGQLLSSECHRAPQHGLRVVALSGGYSRDEEANRAPVAATTA